MVIDWVTTLVHGRISELEMNPSFTEFEPPPASLWLNFLYVPFYRESALAASRGSGLSTKEEHKSQLNYYSTHEIDFCEKNHRGKDESSPS